ncbi:MAG: universal stress protein [Pseudomonadota bacterium]|uniref:universal stress protein n=1 Tax=Fodinicurvata fenggangensis TaxID=1121830 RepID=UPI0005535F83|nr:universal stress protein [Fodinicurvata fenggangensis]
MDEDNDNKPETAASADHQTEGNTERVMLVVVDESKELEVALRYACRRARHTGGRVALLNVLERSEFQTWLGVGELLAQEARSEAEQLLQRAAKRVTELAGSMPILYLREGVTNDVLFKLLDEEDSISILVLGANTGQGGPGPLVSSLTGKFVGRLRVPLTIVPDNLTEEHIDAIS